MTPFLRWVKAYGEHQSEQSELAAQDSSLQSIYQSLVDSVECNASNDTLRCLRQVDAADLAINAQVIINREEPGWVVGSVLQRLVVAE